MDTEVTKSPSVWRSVAFGAGIFAVLLVLIAFLVGTTAVIASFHWLLGTLWFLLVLCAICAGCAVAFAHWEANN